jgi:hypothetical protein
MPKKVTIGSKPKPREQSSPDEWVATGAKESVELTRFTIDIPKTLHSRIKSQCALKGVKMRDEILALLENHFSGKP